METKKINFILLLFLLISINISAQDNRKIRILDQSSQAPIKEVYYQYGIQTGISDSLGMIEITYKEGESLQLTHTSYGKWTLTDKNVKLVLQEGIIFRNFDIYDLQPVSIIALRAKTSESNKLILDYQNKQSHDGGAILNFDPAINGIRKSGNYGYDPVLRGFKYDQLNVVINGSQGATAACPNRMDPPTSQVPVHMIDQVEILKGPYSLRYGNSFGGTINYVTSPPEFSHGFKTYGKLSGTYESNGNIMRSDGLIAMSGQRYNMSILGSWSQGDDYKDGEGNAIPSDFLRGSFGSMLSMKLSNNQQITISANKNIGRDVDFPALPMDLRKDDTWMFSVQHEVSMNSASLKSWKTMVYGTLVDHLMNNYLKDVTKTVNAESSDKTHTYGGRTEGFWNFKKGVIYTGADLRIEGAEGDRTREFLTGPNAGKTVIDNSWQNSQIIKSAIFSEAHYTYKQLLFVLAGRLEINNSKADDTQTKFTDINPETEIMQLNPGISLGLIRNFKNQFSLGLWLGRTQRSGSLTERYINYFAVGQDPYELLGNPQLKPETNNQADITFEWKSEKTILHADLFASYSKAYISPVIDSTLVPVMPTSPGVRQFQNIGEAFRTGIELSWTQSLFLGLQHQLSFAYTYGESIAQNEPLPEIAPMDIRYSLSGNYLKNKLLPEIVFRHVFSQKRISKEFGETETPSFTLIDLNISYKFLKVFNITCGVQNLLDIAYYEHLTRLLSGNSAQHIFAPGRNIFISLTLDLR
ncbi:MAG: TonB-dependent receptor [Bacteroidales bacterium]